MPPLKRKASSMATTRRVAPRANFNSTPNSVLTPRYRRRIAFTGIPAEVKHLSGSGTFQFHTTSTTQELTSLIVQGDGSGNREGHQIFIKTLELSVATRPANATGAASVNRLTVIMDRQCNGAVASWGDAYDAVTPYGRIRWDRRGRFRQFRSWFFNEGPYSATIVPPIGYRTKTMRIPINMYVQYGGNLGTIADVVSNSLYIKTIGDQAPGANYEAVISWRISFMG